MLQEVTGRVCHFYTYDHINVTVTTVANTPRQIAFGSIKQWMNQGAFLTRGLEKIRAEFSLTALAYNMTGVLKIVGIERLLKVFKNAKNPAFSTLYSLFAELTGKLRSFSAN